MKPKHVATADLCVPSDHQKNPNPAPCSFKWSQPRVLCDVVVVWCFGEEKPYISLSQPLEQLKSLQTWSNQLQNSSGMVVLLPIRGYMKSDQSSRGKLMDENIFNRKMLVPLSQTILCDSARFYSHFKERLPIHSRESSEHLFIFFFSLVCDFLHLILLKYYFLLCFGHSIVYDTVCQCHHFTDYQKLHYFWQC